MFNSVYSIISKSKAKRVFFKSQESIMSAALIIALTYIVAYFLGFLKQRLLIETFGVSFDRGGQGELLGTFFLADRIPALIFNVLIAGSISTAFIPIFTNKLQKEGSAASWKLCSGVFNLTLFIFGFVCVFTFLFSKQVSQILTFNSQGVALDQLSNLIKIMILSQMILIFSSFITSSLQSFKRFLVPALAPIFYNVGIILFIVLFSKSLGIYAAAWGMVFGSLLHLAIQAPVLKSLNFKYFFGFFLKDKDVKKVFYLSLPRIMGTTGDQLALVVDNALAYFISPAMTAVLALASSLQRLPVSIFGASIAQASLPTFSSLSSSKIEKFKETIADSLLKMLFFIFPASIFLLVLRVPIVRLVFGSARFSWDATVATSYAVAFFSCSIFAQGFNFILSRAFYALSDTKTPVKINLFALAVNSALSLLFVVKMNFGVWSLALSYSVGILITTSIMFYQLQKRIGVFTDYLFLKKCAKIFWASFITGVCLYVPLKILDNYLFDTTRVLNLLVLTCVVICLGFFSYIRACKLVRLEEASFFKAFFEKLLKSFKNF